MLVREIMTSRPTVCPGETSLDEAMELMEEHDLRHLLITADERLEGVLSDRDLLELTGWLPPGVRRLLDAPTGPVASYMHGSPVTAGPDDEVADSLRRLIERRIGCLPVVDGEQLVGIVTETDFLVAYVRACRASRAAEETAADHMSTDVPCVGPDTPSEDALKLVKEGVRHLPVIDGERLVGMLSDRDLRRAVGRGELENTAVSDFLTRDPLTIAPDAPLSAAAELMAAEKVSALPVVDDGRMVGLLEIEDVLGPCVRALG